MSRRPLLLSLALVAFLAAPATGAEVQFPYPEGKHGKGELRYVNGLPVLVLEGTPEEIGKAYGVLCARPAEKLLHALPELVKSMHLERLYPVILKSGDALLKRIPEAHQKELSAAAEASGFGREPFIFANTMPDFYKVNACSTLVVEPGRSKTGAPLFGRNFDWPPFRDLGAHTIVTVFRPEGKRAFVSVSLPSILGVISGMNDAGLAVTMNEIFFSADGSPQFDPDGMPRVYCLRRILEECSTIAEAEKLVRSVKRTTTMSLTLCDKEGGAVFEVSPKNVVVRRAVNDVCLCTNHFRCEGMVINQQCWRYKILLKTEESEEKLGVRDVYRRLDAVSQKDWTMHAMVFEPAELRLHLSVGVNESATKNGLHKIELAELFGKRE